MDGTGEGVCRSSAPYTEVCSCPWVKTGSEAAPGVDGSGSGLDSASASGAGTGSARVSL